MNLASPRHGYLPYDQHEPYDGLHDNEVEEILYPPNQQPIQHLHGNFKRFRDAPVQHDFHCPHNNHNPVEFRVKVDIPSFNGLLYIEDFLDWITTMKRFFEYIVIHEDKQVKLVAFKLTDEASSWWEQIQQD